MSNTGNIRGGPRSQDFGSGREERTRIGRAPQGPGGPGGSGVPGGPGSDFSRDDKTSVGRAPQAPAAPPPPPPKPSDALRSEAPKTGIYNFVQDGLETKDEVRPRDVEPGVFEQQDRDSPRPSSERPRVRPGSEDARASASFEDARDPDSPRSTSERPRLPSKDGEARTDTRSRSPRDADGARSTSERPRLPSKDGEARTDTRSRSPRDADGARSTSERPRMRSRGEDGEVRTDKRNRTRDSNSPDGMRSADERPRTRSRPALDPRQDKPASPKTGERAALNPKTGERAALNPKTGERAALNPKTGERAALPPQKALVKQPAVPAGNLLGPELAPDTPEGVGDAKPLEELLPLFSEAIDQESLAHHFKEELGFLGTDLRSLQLPRSTRAQRIWAFFISYAEANARTPDTHTVKGKELFQAALQEHGFAELQDAHTGKDGVATAMELLEAKTPEQLQQKLADVRMEAKPEPVRTEVPAQPESPPQAEAHKTEQPTPQAQAQAKGAPERTEQKPGVPPPAFDQAEPEKALAAQLQPNHAPNTPLLQVTPQRTLRQDELSPEDLYKLGRDRRGTDKRLGSHMLWNVLHKLRDSPEDDAVKREQWSQLAFGAILFLVGAFLLVVLLVSL